MEGGEEDSLTGNHLRAWREFRGLTQAQLAALVGTEGSVISLLESGDRGLSGKWLRRLAPVLGTTPGLLLDYDPDKVDVALIDTFVHIKEAMKPAALESLRRRLPQTDGRRKKS